MIELNNQFWNQKYEKEDTGWDIGYPSTPLATYFDQLNNKELSILIPGCGNAYEAEYLVEQGFQNVFLIDISERAVEKLRAKMPQIPKERIICGDFFEHQGAYDLIVEQTFFCALNPNLRPAYVKKMHELLKKGGKLMGLLFDDPLFDDHPPFGGSKAEYKTLFEPHFTFHYFETAHNSIPPRTNRELFMLLEK